MKWNACCWQDDDIAAEDKADKVTSNVGIVVVIVCFAVAPNTYK